MSYLQQMLKTVRSQPVPSLPDTPFGLALITIPKQDYINLKQQANYWQSQYQRVSAREKEARASAKATIDQLKKGNCSYFIGKIHLTTATAQ